jgi:hypothetical protein
MRKQLERARADRRYVTVRRRKGWAEVDGFVAAVGPKWFVVVCVSDAAFEGLAVLRIKDVRRVRRRGGHVLAKRALKHDGLWPPSVPELLDLDSARRVAFTAGSLCRVLSLSMEGPRPRVFFVANIYRITRRHIEAWEIDPKARWADDLSVPLEQLSRVVLRDPYVEKVTAIADAHEGNLWAVDQPGGSCGPPKRVS